jgi:hypothetical protein
MGGMVDAALKVVRPYLRKPKRESGWLPIDTAPKDGTVFWAIHAQDCDERQLQGEKDGWMHLRLPFTCRYIDPHSEDDEPYFAKVDECNLFDTDVEAAFWMPITTLEDGMS